MPTERWHRLEQLFTEAVAQPVHARADFLDRACGADRGLREEIGSLLTAAEHSGNFLCAPAIEVFARQIASEGWTVRPGDRIASYTVGQRLGAGAMGEVWRARDERLARDVAIKFLLPQASDAERVHAFAQEARAAGTLNHPNVLTVHDVGEHRGAPFLVTECLEGESLRARLDRGALPIDTALDIAAQAARGLAAAHERGIVHRDLKPENIFLARDGRAKILDFGLATLLDAGGETAASTESPFITARSLAAGTAGYMAPEQVRGDMVDQRADIFALGAVLYEMLAGRPPFKGDSTLATLDACLSLDPGDLSLVKPEIPPALARLAGRCLAKAAADRFATIAEFASALDAVLQSRHPVHAPTVYAVLRKPAVTATMVALVMAVLAGAWLLRKNSSRVRWARTVAAPEIQRLSNRGDNAEAFVLARQALDIAPDDPHLRQLWLDLSVPMAMTTVPPDAEVAFTSYRHPATWFVLGRTPLAGVRIPRALVRLRVSRSGFQSIETSFSPGAVARYQLDPLNAIPAGMVRVVGGRDLLRFGAIGDLPDFWIDRFEVTNREFKSFVDQGGYQRREYWREPFVERGRSLRWEDAVLRLRDATGQPGPATWASGTYAAGEDDFPVGGLSWYEAAAYAAFRGKSLPTIYHWYRAAGLGRFSDILAVSNFSGKGPSPVGSYGGVGPFGTFDMAGNVKEWCANESAHGRFILGGGWSEPRYMFADDDARDPFERGPANGVRLVKYLAPAPSPVTAPVTVAAAVRDASTRKPVGDDIFAVYRRLYAYDRTPLNAAVEASEETSLWRKHTVAFDAAYGGERMRAYLFLPKTGRPPYQSVVFFPAADAFQLRSSRDMSLASLEFIIRSGRAFFYPVYKGTYEREVSGAGGPNQERDLYVAWSRDLGRAIDYLDTRPDIDRTRLAYYGVSAGADAGVVLAALEPRLKACVLQGTGVLAAAASEIDAVNFAPRLGVPTLLLNGRYDFGVPFETSQRPLFSLLGAAAGDKRHVVFETGHALPIDDVAREVLPWLDRYLGRVASGPP